MSENSTETAHHHLMKSILGVAAKVAIVVLPALGTSYFSYRQATTEAVSNTAVTKNKAEAGYQTLVEASEKANKIIFDLEKNIARLEGRLQGIEIAFRISLPTTGGNGPVSSPGRPRPRPVMPAPPEPARSPVSRAPEGHLTPMPSPPLVPPPAPAAMPAPAAKMAPPLPRTLDQAFEKKSAAKR
jgi:hypothetical protein